MRPAGAFPSEAILREERDMSLKDASVVLVHGAWADGSSWRKVIGLLKAQGIRVFAAPLPLTSLADDTAALAPDEGETVSDVFYRAKPHPQAPALAPDSHGLIWLPEGAFATAFAQHASAAEQALLAAVQRPIALPCIGVKVERPLWKDRPSWFLVAEEDRMIAPDTQHFMAKRMKARLLPQPVDHSPIVTAPNVVVDVISGALRG